jgi:hypothetical protein
MSGRWRLFASRVNPSCRDMMGLASRSLEAPLGRGERIILAIHLLHCPACRRSRRQIFLLVSMIRRLSGAKPGDSTEAIPGLSREVRERIKRALRQE